MSDLVDQLKDELKSHARAANRHQAAYKREIAQVRELLVAVRLADPDLGPGTLERLIEGALERGTISRLTAPAIGASRTRKPA